MPICTNQRKNYTPPKSQQLWGAKSVCVPTQKFYTWCIWQDKPLQLKEEKIALSGADRSDQSNRPVRPVCPRQPAKNHNTSINCITLSQILLDNINKVHYTQYHTLQVLKSTNDRYRIITVSEFTKIQTGLSQTDQHSELRLSFLPLLSPAPSFNPVLLPLCHLSP